MKILLSAYACEPGKGSEPGIGWNWALALSKTGHEVWVVTRGNNRPVIETALEKYNRIKNLHFIYFDLPFSLMRRKKGYGGIYIYYLLWQIGAGRKAKDVHKIQKFDIVHHVSFSSCRQPSFMGSLGIPFIFGPVGGGETAPSRLRRGYGIRGRLLDFVRGLSNNLIKFDPLMGRTFRQADQIWVTTSQTADAIPERFRGKLDISLAIGKNNTIRSPGQPPQKRNGIKLVYAGQFIYWKGMHIGIRAFSKLLKKHPDARLTLIGDGPEKQRWQCLARQLGVDTHLTWKERVPSRQDLFTLFSEFDLFLFPSLHDSGGMVALESLACGLPVVCLDLGGPGVIVNETCGIKIPVENQSIDQVAQAVAHSVGAVAADKELLKKMGKNALDRAEDFTWSQLVKTVYHKVLPENG